MRNIDFNQLTQTIIIVILTQLPHFKIDGFSFPISSKNLPFNGQIKKSIYRFLFTLYLSVSDLNPVTKIETQHLLIQFLYLIFVFLPPDMRSFILSHLLPEPDSCDSVEGNPCSVLQENVTIG